MRKMAKHAADIVAALTPPPRHQEVAGEAPVAAQSTTVTKRPSALKATLGLAAPVGGAVGGALLWKQHRILGGVSGLLAGAQVPELLGTKDERTTAFCALGSIGAGVLGSSLWHKHPTLGYVGGLVAGVVVSAFVPGTPLNEEYYKQREDWTEKAPPKRR